MVALDPARSEPAACTSHRIERPNLSATVPETALFGKQPSSSGGRSLPGGFDHRLPAGDVGDQPDERVGPVAG